MTRNAKLAAVVAGAIIAWSIPAAAFAVAVSTSGSLTYEYSIWEGIAVDDVKCDSHDVYSDYKRDSGTSQVLRNSQGCNGGNEYSGTSTNLIQRFNSCTDDWGPNTCSSTVWR